MNEAQIAEIKQKLEYVKTVELWNARTGLCLQRDYIEHVAALLDEVERLRKYICAECFKTCVEFDGFVPCGSNVCILQEAT